MHGEDVYVIFIIVAVGVVWGLIRLKRWLEAPAKIGLVSDGEIPQGETVEILESAGYRVLSGKKRIPIHITVNGIENLQSRLYIDYFARGGREDSLYAVKVAKERKPLDMTGSGIRDALLAYYLIDDDIDGVLYVDPKEGTVTEILFEIDPEG